MRNTIPAFVTFLAASVVASAAACSSTSSQLSATSSSDAGGAGGADAGDAGSPPKPFQADPPGVYLSKVKNVLVGLPPTDAELQAVEQNPASLGSIVDGWMQQPEYSAKMLRFFELAFQQTQVGATDFSDQAYPRQIVLSPYTSPLLVQNAQESFARTMLALIAQGKPLQIGMTTQQYMMTTAMKELYAFLDVYEVDDAGKVTDYFKKANPNLTITVEASGGPIPIDQTVDPSNSNFMHWYDPDVTKAGARVPGCQVDPIVYPASAATLHFLLYGSLDAHKQPDGTRCNQYGGTAQAAQLQPSDFNDWQLVTVRPPNQGETVTQFWNLSALRKASEIVLNIPRVGFFSTPAFFANWQTNKSNTMRVTTNQALIVATGSDVDGTDTTTPPGVPGLDNSHATQPACFNCHKVLDPTRSILSSTYSWNYHSQLDSTETAQPGVFAFRGVIQPVKSVADFGAALANHPLFATGWAQKLCFYVNSAPCAPADLQALATAWQSSGYAWNALVKALVTSPVTTNVAQTPTTAANGEVIAVSRRDHLCAAINARLGFQDVCGLLPTTNKATLGAIPQIVLGLPSDAYGRGAPLPILPTQPTLFFRAATENMCEGIAAQVIDNPKAPAGAKTWSSQKPDAAISDFVGIVMGLAPSDPRAAPASALLHAHFTAAAAQSGITATQALESTFVVACLSPSAVSIGM